MSSTNKIDRHDITEIFLKVEVFFLKYNVKYFNALIYPASVLDSFVRTVEHLSSFIPMEYIFD